MTALGSRPLDRVRSVKVKLGLLVVASIVVTALLTWYGLLVLGWWPRYTLPVAVLVGLGVTQVLARGMTSPLRQMTAAAREMAAGRPPGRVRATSRDEVGELARAFTAMAADLAAADTQRRELLANVGHELRTPVAALRAQLENVVDGVRPADGPAMAELLTQAERLGVLVDDLLDLARAEAGVTPLQRRPVVVAALIAEVVRDVEATRPGPTVRSDVPEGLVVDVDPARLRQVLVNLIDNAARHAGGGGCVDVVARPLPRGGLALEVIDDGPGIEPQHREAVFGRFHRGALAALTQDGVLPPAHDGGTGLGLAIARWAVGLHGGTIAVVPSPPPAPPSAPGDAAAAPGCRIRVELPGRAS